MVSHLSQQDLVRQGSPPIRPRIRAIGTLPFLIAAVCLLFSAGALSAKTISVTQVRHWSLGIVTRVAVQTTGEFTFKYRRLSNPDRIYFDILRSRQRVSKGPVHVIEVNDGLVRQIRVAQNRRYTTRVVLDLVGKPEVSTSQLANPDRLIIEIRSKTTKLAQQARRLPPPKRKVAAVPKPAVKTAPKAPAPKPKTAVATAKSSPGKTPLKKPAKVAKAKSAPAKPASKTPVKTIAKKTPAAPPVQSASAAPSPVKKPKAVATSAQSSSGKAAPKAPVKVATAKPAPKPAPKATPAPPPEPAPVKSAKKKTPAPKQAATRKTGKAVPVKTAAKTQPPKKVKSASASSAKKKTTTTAKATPPPKEKYLIPKPAKRNRSGGRSLTRVLGLKLGRVVIDPGHGGRDTGTIGPTGLREKNVTLDVAKRLAKLIKERMGSEVVLTRSSDTSVPLEARTRFANEQQADLFLSIHVNSSRYRSVNGVETFYLNLTRSRADLEVAARENAGSNMSIHELSGLLQKIALDDKVQESKDLAANIQTAVHHLARKYNSRARNRGVKKAPFVVLIGAQMPSALVELGFISNPSEERRMKKASYRQKIAEALYQGLYKYANSLSHFQVASTTGSTGE